MISSMLLGTAIWAILEYMALILKRILRIASKMKQIGSLPSFRMILTMCQDKKVQKFLHFLFLLRSFQVKLEFELLDRESHGILLNPVLGT